jgi:hypothetical protein
MLVSTGHSPTQSFKHGSVTEKQCLMKGTATTVNPQVNKIMPSKHMAAAAKMVTPPLRGGWRFPST